MEVDKKKPAREEGPEPAEKCRTDGDTRLSPAGFGRRVICRFQDAFRVPLIADS